MDNYTGEKVRELRTGARLTQSSLAKLLGISPSAVGMYEQGRRFPDADTLVKLGQIFGVTVDSLLGADEISEEVTDIIREMRGRIKNDSNLTLNGTLMTQAERERLLSAIEIATDLTLREKAAKTGACIPPKKGNRGSEFG